MSEGVPRSECTGKPEELPTAMHRCSRLSESPAHTHHQLQVAHAFRRVLSQARTEQGRLRAGWGQTGREEVSPAHPGQPSQSGFSPAREARGHTCSSGSGKKGLDCSGGLPRAEWDPWCKLQRFGPSFFASWGVSFLVSIVI